MTIRTIAHKRLVVGEKKQRFGFRKTILGLCGAILGSTLLMADAANNAHTVHAAESDPNQAKSVQIDDRAAKEVAQTTADAAKDNGASTDASKASAKTLVEAKGNEGTNTANGLNGKAGKYVPNQNQVTTHSEDTHSEVTGKTNSTSPSSSSVTKADSANATSTNEYSASASNLSKTGAASTSNSTEVKTNVKYANPVETVDNNKRGNRENTHSINQIRIVKRSAVVSSADTQRKV